MKYVADTPSPMLGRRLDWDTLASKVKKDKWLQVSDVEFRKMTGSEAKTVVTTFKQLPRFNGHKLACRRRERGKALYFKWE